MTPSACLTASILVPLLGAVIAACCRTQTLARWVAFSTTLLTCVLTFVVVWQAYPVLVDGHVVEGANLAWSGSDSGWDIRFHVALDGLSIWLYALSALLMMTAVLVSWQAITDRAPLYYCMLLLLLAGCLGVFAAQDVILFYVFFEFTLIPLFFLIGIWGSEDRRYAAIKFFLYTLAGSLLTFLGLLSLVVWAHWHGSTDVVSFSIPELMRKLAAYPIHATHHEMEVVIFLALFAGFAIKVPLFPLHTWLPLAHVQAPTAGSVFLAGILLKIGTYGFLRFSLPLLPYATAVCMPWILGLAGVGILYGALVALAQSDVKRLVAYSSVSHLGYCMLGLFAVNLVGAQGAVLQMVNHGISTGALFAMIGMLYERFHTRRMDQMSGLARQMPWFGFFFVLFTFSSIGVPGLNGFAGEFLVLVGMFQRAWGDAASGASWGLRLVSIVAVVGIVFGAWYMLRLVRCLLFGPERIPAHDTAVRDLSFREIAALAPLAVFVFWIGVQPAWFLRPTQPTVQRLVQAANQTLAAPESVQLAVQTQTSQVRKHQP